MRRAFVALLVFLVALLAVGAACGDSAEPTYSPPAASDRAEPVSEAMADEPAAARPAPTAAPAPQESDGGAGVKVQPAPLSQNRIIVHNARMSLVVSDVAESVDGIAGVAHQLGGWVVNSDRSSQAQREHSCAGAGREPGRGLQKVGGAGLEGRLPRPSPVKTLPTST